MKIAKRHEIFISYDEVIITDHPMSRMREREATFVIENAIAGFCLGGGRGHTHKHADDQAHKVRHKLPEINSEVSFPKKLSTNKYGRGSSFVPIKYFFSKSVETQCTKSKKRR